MNWSDALKSGIIRALPAGLVAIALLGPPSPARADTASAAEIFAPPTWPVWVESSLPWPGPPLAGGISLAALDGQGERNYLPESGRISTRPSSNDATRTPHPPSGWGPGSRITPRAMIKLPSAKVEALRSPEMLWAFAARAVLALLTLAGGIWMLRRERVVNRIASPGFEVISPGEKRQFIPLEERFQAMDFINKIKTAGDLRLSANLNKVTLSIRRYGYLMEDKNYRNALLVNRRRVRRTLLKDGDVLDLGDLTLLYRDNRIANIIRYSSITPPEGKSQLKFDRPKGPTRRGMAMLVSDQFNNRVFHITKNKIFIGRSEANDLVIKSRAVYYRHAKIERVGGRFKLQDLSILGNTFVNNRRVEQRFLKDGDEISIETHRFKFQIVTKTVRERPPAQEMPSDTQEEAIPDEITPGEESDDINDQELSPSP